MFALRALALLSVSSCRSQPAQVRIDYAIQFQARASLLSDFFDPRSLGYVPPEEIWLSILDDLLLAFQFSGPVASCSSLPSRPFS